MLTIQMYMHGKGHHASHRVGALTLMASPMAKMCGTEVHSRSSTTTLPAASNFTPTAERLRPAVEGTLPAQGGGGGGGGEEGGKGGGGGGFVVYIV